MGFKKRVWFRIFLDNFKQQELKEDKINLHCSLSLLLYCYNSSRHLETHENNTEAENYSIGTNFYRHQLNHIKPYN
ncbi:hypothetical protein BpHYR1_011749 [Brachionus plicatilis]|uniref:Uncharacterized protein n=1 Tax=Brachionus plicatilis TaxID=10195 RepID=A0A3M7P9H3_BRAPC|nr:hypothetical protein BpHYR1_011749 [Brachionus plicatilis]